MEQTKKILTNEEIIEGLSKILSTPLAVQGFTISKLERNEDAGILTLVKDNGDAQVILNLSSNDIIEIAEQVKLFLFIKSNETFGLGARNII